MFGRNSDITFPVAFGESRLLHEKGGGDLYAIGQAPIPIGGFIPEHGFQSFKIFKSYDRVFEKRPSSIVALKPRLNQIAFGGSEPDNKVAHFP